MATALATRPLRFETSDGLTLVGDMAGSPDRPTVMLMHGGGQTRHSWAGTMATMERAGYQVIAYDARGHGESGWAQDRNYSLARRAQDLIELTGTIAGPIALVGASLGGATSLSALLAGYRPAALSLVDIVPRPNPEGVARIRAFMRGNPDGFASLDEAIDAVAAYNPHRPRGDGAGLRRNLRAGPDGRLHWHWDPAILADDVRLEIAEFQNTISGIGRFDGIVPIQLVRGTQSDVVDETGVEQLRAELPSLEIADVAEAGHMVAGDRNDAFTASLLPFLQRHMPADPIR